MNFNSFSQYYNTKYTLIWTLNQHLSAHNHQLREEKTAHCYSALCSLRAWFLGSVGPGITPNGFVNVTAHKHNTKIMSLLSLLLLRYIHSIQTSLNH